jgi:hypothetical protein
MIDSLEKLDKRTAAGVLARAAIALEGEGNPAASVTLEGEAAIRAALVQEARAALGFESDDYRPETIEKVGDFLDEKAERLIGPPDTQSALERMAERGTLASDLYQISIVPSISQFHGKGFELERHLIERTIRSPDREHHYGPSDRPAMPSLISLFTRQFKTPWPFKDFTLLVGAQRHKLVLNVHQAWRLYPPIVDIRGANLVDLLRRFADAYGYDIEVGGQMGHFFLSAEHPVPTSHRIQLSHGKTKTVAVSQFIRDGVASLIVAIDLDRYRGTLEKMEVNADQIR